jgi:hypothetical protein
MSRKTLLAWVLLVSTAAWATAQDPMQPLKVDASGHNLVTADGAPFFWLGDAAWPVLRLKQPQILQYLDGRLADGYNVIQGPVLIDFEGGKPVPDGAGDLPLTDPKDPTSLNEKYFAAADAFVAEAQKRFFYVVLAPISSDGAANYSPDQLKALGNILGARYKGKVNVLWMVFGSDAARVNALASGLDAGNGGMQLISVHPELEKGGAAKDGLEFHSSNWLDFTAVKTDASVQSGGQAAVASAYAASPAKPVLGVSGLAEEVQEQFGGGTSAGGQGGNGYAVRQQAYESVFNGGMGTASSTKAMMGLGASQAGDDAAFDTRQALDTPGGDQLHCLKELMLSRPMASRFPDPSLVLKNQGVANDGAPVPVASTRDGTPGKADATWLMVYVGRAAQVIIDTSDIPGRTLTIWRYDPRTGNALQLEKDLPNPGQVNFAPQEDDLGPDWVVVIDDASKKYPAPGSKPYRK